MCKILSFCQIFWNYGKSRSELLARWYRKFWSIWLIYYWNPIVALQVFESFYDKPGYRAKFWFESCKVSDRLSPPVDGIWALSNIRCFGKPKTLFLSVSLDPLKIHFVIFIFFDFFLRTEKGGEIPRQEQYDYVTLKQLSITVGFHSPKIWLLPKVSLLVVDFLQEIVKSDTFCQKIDRLDGWFSP